eukprot:TRINITY_DN51068_c0_g1_i1.p1 TRINITY_DN51068_c0_g1~~TRINITY_DN51068_c0_g1_i1.p1  ORF type:complete len:798 (-),score=137.76 TRINITY_DN51068_c0_g1_i1:642-2945(-)
MAASSADGWPSCDTIADEARRVDAKAGELERCLLAGDAAGAAAAASFLAHRGVPVRLSLAEDQPGPENMPAAAPAGEAAPFPDGKTREVAASAPSGGGSHFLTGSDVEYYSQTHGAWVAAKVLGYDEASSTYCLDVHPQALSHKVRAAQSGHQRQSAPSEANTLDRMAIGAPAEYFSTTHGGWVPAVVKGFNEESNSYILDVQPMALLSKVRPAVASSKPAAAQAATVAAQADAARSTEKQGSATQGSTDKHPARFEKQCTACGQRFPVDAVQGPLCGHLFCTSCLRSHIMASSEDFISQAVTCPVEACGSTLELELIRLCLGPAEYAAAEKRLVARDEELARLCEQEESEPGSSAARGAGARLERHRTMDIHEGALGADVNGRGATSSHAGYGRQPHAASVLAAGCMECGEPNAVENLFSAACNHSFCRKCVRRHILQFNYILDPVSCPLQGCETSVDTEMIRKAIGLEVYERVRAQVDEQVAKSLQQKYEQEQRSVQEARAAEQSFQCPLCLEKGQRDGFIELDCSHRFCADCFGSYIGSKVTDGQVADDELVCPMPGCGKAITVDQVQGATAGTAVWEKYLQFRANLWTPGSDEGSMVQCPSGRCGRFLVPRAVKTVTCPICQMEFCPKCGQKSHEGSTCEQFRDWRRQNEQGEKLLEDLMASQNWRRCPVCGAPSERESGCNFLQCRSDVCRKRTYWCWICGLQKTLEEHYTHYPRGPYEDECFTPEDQRVSVAQMRSGPRRPEAQGANAAGGLAAGFAGLFG